MYLLGSGSTVTGAVGGMTVSRRVDDEYGRIGEGVSNKIKISFFFLIKKSLVRFIVFLPTYY